MSASWLDGFRDPALAQVQIARLEQLAAELAGLPETADSAGPAESTEMTGLSETAQSAESTKLEPAAQVSAAPRPLRLMEVCGTHTVAIARAGLRSILPANLQLISGPGCPVCVTANADIDRIIALTRIPNLTVLSFGDMIRVPGSSTSLQQRKAEGAAVEVVYSPLDALRLAAEQPERQFVFVGVGFETTTPLIAACIERARAQNLHNFSVLAAHKQVPSALAALACDPQVQLDALILPGHVSTILGLAPYAFVAARYNIPGVVTGFEPIDLLQGLLALLEQLLAMRRDGASAHIGNAYRRAVMDEGNPTARSAIERVFMPADAVWRGLGTIADSGYRLRPEFADFDASCRFELDVEPTVEPRGCQCGEVLRGILPPNRCRLFGRACTPQNPIGPCMVSSEGSCAAYYRYQVED
ncbi:MAG: hydrogenase formation protein HypD [Coriobacteriales bacterium]|jgi:hydrogenase expression/formation protein HypD|nr:hydrogenase formation protein HypD [Coriobacteriales bacterium]